MADQTDKLASFQGQVEILNHGQRAFGRGVGLVQLRIVQIARLKRRGGGAFIRPRQRVAWGDAGQMAGLGQFGLDAHIHQIGGHIGPQRLEPPFVQRSPVAGAGQGHVKRLPQGAIGVQAQNAVGEDQRLIHVIGYHHGGALFGAPDRLNLCRHIGAGQGIQRRQRLIQQQDFGPHRQSTGHRHPLAHAPGQFRRAAVTGMGQADHLDIAVHLGNPFGLGALVGGINGQLDIARHRQPRHQRVGLKHQPPLWSRPGHGGAFEPHLTVIGQRQPCHQVHQRGLARPRKAQDHDEFAILYRKGQVAQDRRFAEPLGDV